MSTLRSSRFSSAFSSVHLSGIKSFHFHPLNAMRPVSDIPITGYQEQAIHTRCGVNVHEVELALLGVIWVGDTVGSGVGNAPEVAGPLVVGVG